MVSLSLFAVLLSLLPTMWVTAQRASVNVQFQLTEECPEGTLVGCLSEDVSLHAPQYLANKPNGDSYQLLTATQLFELDSTSGTIITSGRIDREEICPPIQNSHQASTGESAAALCSIDLQVLRLESQTASGAYEPQVILVKIFILDINDNAPTWQEDSVNITIPEHTAPGSRFLLPLALDADCGPENTTSRYFLFSSNIRDGDYGGSHVHSSDISRYFKLDTEVVEQKDPQHFVLDRWSNGWNLQACTGPTLRLWLQIIGEADYETPGQLSLIQQKQPLSKNDDKANVPPRTFVLKLAAVDGSRFVPKTGSVTIRVSVKDINDHAPYFLPPEDSSVDGMYAKIKVDGTLRRNSATIEVQENAPYGQALYTPHVVEPDISDRESLIFSFDSTTTPAARAVFGIREKDGTIFLKQSPDYETQNFYILPIVVSDGKYVDNQELRVQILNLNDHAPIITIRPVRTKKPEAEIHNQQHQQVQRYKPIYLEVEEDRPPGHFIATVLLSDEDQVSGTSAFPSEGTAAFQCQLSHDSLSLEPLFEGSQSQFKLVTRVSFDREQLGELFVALTCHDSGQPRQTSRVDIKLLILDKNDNKPVFKNHPMLARVKENSLVGVNVYRLEAFDADVGKNAALVYFISGEGADNFKVDRHSGLVTTAATIDREIVGRFNLMVVVRDRNGNETGSGEPINEGTAMLTVEVLDENDCAPEFDKPLYQFLIDENAKINTPIGEVKARDNDATAENNRIRYFIKDEIMNPANQDFRVTADGRVLVGREMLDRETTSMYLFTVVAVDSGKPSLSATAQVQVHLGDINDNAPTWLFPPETNVVVNVTIHEPVGHQVALLRASDPDLGENGQIMFKIIHVSVLSNAAATSDSRNDSQTEIELVKPEMFELDPSTGALYIARPLRASDMGLVKLLIEASDMGKPNKSSHRTILFNIMDFQRPKYTDPSGNRIGAPFTSGGPGFQHHDLVVIVVMVAVAIVISLFLIVAMLFLRCPVCLFHDRPMNSYNNVAQTTVGLPSSHMGAHQEAYLPEVFRDSHAIGTLSGKDGSLVSGEETLFYPTNRDKIIPSRGSVSGKNVLTIDYDGALQDGTLAQYQQSGQFFILAKPDGGYAVSMDGTPIELSTLENANVPQHHHHQQQQIQQQTSEEQDIRTSQSTSCLSGLSTQLTTTPNGYHSESDLEEEPLSTKKSTWRTRKGSTGVERAGRTKATTLGRITSSPRKVFKDENPYPQGGAQETLRLLTTTSPTTPSGSGAAASETVKNKQCYTMLVNTPSTTPTKVTAEQLRYVQIHNTPTHLGKSTRSNGGSGGVGGGSKKSAPTVSWRMEPQELHTYSPENETGQTALTGQRTFVDLENGYACLGKGAETNVMPPYDQLVHRLRDVDVNRDEVTSGGSFSEFSSSVI
ncbi:protocadherin 9 [Echinococcus multilocularis]|uniref:Protocadherin 9 n=1 Tax=Echinococcus multilocularis TaxID=6211 RepID=A0A068YKP2_ECHMU|nr:protocadherin 9 [Echinococcus multilocularis]